jgi:hypothetical protein
MELPNKYDAYQWVLKLIKSCNTPSQIARTGRLLRSFDKIFNDSYLYDCLRLSKDMQTDKILNKDREL